MKPFVVVGKEFIYGIGGDLDSITSMNIGIVTAKDFTEAVAYLGAKIKTQRDNEVEIEFEYEKVVKGSAWQKQEGKGFIKFTMKGFQGIGLPVFFDATTKAPTHDLTPKFMEEKRVIHYYLQSLPEL